MTTVAVAAAAALVKTVLALANKTRNEPAMKITRTDLRSVINKTIKKQLYINETYDPGIWKEVGGHRGNYAATHSSWYGVQQGSLDHYIMAMLGYIVEEIPFHQVRRDYQRSDAGSEVLIKGAKAAGIDTSYGNQEFGKYLQTIKSGLRNLDFGNIDPDAIGPEEIGLLQKAKMVLSSAFQILMIPYEDNKPSFSDAKLMADYGIDADQMRTRSLDHKFNQ